MKRELAHSVLACVLIATQLLLVVFGHGRVMVCHDDAGSSHIELVGDRESSLESQDQCGGTCAGRAPAEVDSSGIRSGSSCVDEVLRFTFTANTHRSFDYDGIDVIGSIDLWVMLSWISDPLSNDCLGSQSERAQACALQEHNRSIRSAIILL